MKMRTANTVTVENVEIDIEDLKTAISTNPQIHAITLARCRVVDAVINALDKEDKARLNGDDSKVYECIACGTTFKEEDGEHKNGWLVCPSCWHEDLREVTSDDGNDNETS